MQEKRNKKLAVLLLILTGITVSFYWVSAKRNDSKVDRDIFGGFDLKTVDQVVLKSTSETISLRVEASQWKVNGKYPADRNMVDVLFATLQQCEPKRPLSSNQRDSVGIRLEKEGVRVNILSKDDVLLDFYCGGNAQKTQAYFKKAGDEEVYLVNIPGYRVYVSGIFELPEAGWRDKYVFGFNWRNFRSLEAGFEDSKKNFTIEMDDSYFGIAGLEAVDTTRLNDYLDAVSLLTVDDYVQDTAALTDLKRKAPLLNLKVTDIANRQYSLRIYPAPQRGSFLGYINEQEWAVIQGNKLLPINHSREFFVRQ